MKTQSVLLCAAMLAFGATASVAQQDKTARDKPPGFNELDKDNDGVLSRAEAAGNPGLAAKFDTVDDDGDGKLSRFEYLKEMAKEDLTTLRERAAELIDPDKPQSSSGGR